jgi:conjugal transfer pilus assembly protein TraV
MRANRKIGLRFNVLLRLALSLMLNLFISVLLSGCLNQLSGIGGTSDLACEAPAGVSCRSVSGVYANTQRLTQAAKKKEQSLNYDLGEKDESQSSAFDRQNETTSVVQHSASQRAQPKAFEPLGHSSESVALNAPKTRATPPTETALPSDMNFVAKRSPPDIVHLWIAPWVDRDGDWHREAVINVLIHEGQWLLPDNTRAPNTPPPPKVQSILPTVLPSPMK